MADSAHLSLHEATQKENINVDLFVGGPIEFRLITHHSQCQL